MVGQHVGRLKQGFGHTMSFEDLSANYGTEQRRVAGRATDNLGNLHVPALTPWPTSMPQAPTPSATCLSFLATPELLPFKFALFGVGAP